MSVAVVVRTARARQDLPDERKPLRFNNVVDKKWEPHLTETRIPQRSPPRLPSRAELRAPASLRVSA